MSAATSVLINVHGNLPEPGRPVVGNGIRARQLGDALAAHGVTVRYATHRSFYADTAPPPEVALFRDAAGFLELLSTAPPDLLICVQGEGLELLPDSGLACAVMADWIAPRMLEFAFQELPLEQWLPSILTALRKADYHTCCTPAQRAYLYALLQLAGVDIRDCAVDLVPLSAATDFPAPQPAGGEPLLVAGGVSWPWIRSGRYLRAVLEEMDKAGRGRLRIFGGRYPFATDASQYSEPEKELPASDRLEIMGLLPYDQLLDEYRSAWAAVNLFEENPERQLAFSFREIDYLKCGLPLLCAPFSHIAPYIRRHEAGWVLESMTEKELRRTVRRILALERIPAAMSAAAQAIVREHFDQRQTIRPVLDYLARPTRPPRRESLLQSTVHWGDFARQEMQKLLAELRALREQNQELARHNEEYRRLEEEKNRHLAAAESTIRELRQYTAAREKDLARCDRLIREKDRQLTEINENLLELRTYVAQKETDLRQYDRLVSEKDSRLQELDAAQAAQKAELAKIAALVQEKDELLRRADQTMAELRGDNRAKEGELQRYQQLLQDKDAQLKQAEQTMAELRDDSRAKEGELQRYQLLLQDKDAQLKQAEQTMTELRGYMDRKEEDLRRYSQLTEEKDNQLRELERLLGEQRQYASRKEQELAGNIEQLSRKEEIVRQQHSRMKELEEEKAALAGALENIQSKMLYRLYKKIKPRK